MENDRTKHYGMTDVTKNDRILTAENRRYDLTSDIEDVLDNYALHTSNKGVAKRKHALGKSPNDWQR